jgi:hypothetical protein
MQYKYTIRSRAVMIHLNSKTPDDQSKFYDWPYYYTMRFSLTPFYEKKNSPFH